MFRTSNKFASLCFTMVELIVVLIIVSMMMIMGIAVYRKAGNQTGSTAGARRMADMIARARQNAILENTRVALLLPEMTSVPNSHYFQSGDHPDDHSDDHPGIQIGFCEVNKAGVFARWIKGAGWTSMPDDVYFTSSNLWTVSGVDVPGTGTGITTNAIVFLPNGTLPSNRLSNSPSPPLNQGELWIKPYSTASNRYDPGSAARYKITIDWLTGKSTMRSYQ